jgi:hypothetical protein
MPNKDGTGPGGKGPMTGWRGGFCAKKANGRHEQTDFQIGRGPGWGRHRLSGWGVRGRFRAAPQRLTTNQ